MSSYAKFTGLKSYRVRKSAARGRSAHMWEIVSNPFRLHLVVADSGDELIAVGSQTAARFPRGNGRWFCSASSNISAFAIAQLLYEFTPILPPVGDHLLKPPAMQRTIEIATQPEVAVGTDSTRVYRYALRLPTEILRERMFVLETGLPKRVEVIDEAGSTTETIDFQDYDAAIVISMPACR